MDNKHIIGEGEFLSKEVKARKYRGKKLNLVIMD